MKKRFNALMLCIVSISVCATAQSLINIYTISGNNYYGELIAHTDTTLTVKDTYTMKTATIPAKFIESARNNDGSRYLVVDSKLVFCTKEEAKAKLLLEEQKRMGDPNYAIGKAFKKTGGLAIGLGIPCLITGTILCAVGSKTPKTDILKDPDGYAKEAKSHSNMTIAGCVLAGTGGALTIVGIPLSVHGKKLMNLALQVSENGPGVAVKF